MFIVFEGGEGSGKSTQIKLLKKNIELCLGLSVKTTKEPGGTGVGSDIRNITLSKSVDPYTLLFLSLADRVEHLKCEILNYKETCDILISDRYYYSTVSYQGYGSGIDLKYIDTIHGGLGFLKKPDMVVYLDILPEVGLKRAKKRGELDSIESQSILFHQRVREGYIEQVKNDPELFFIVDGSEPMYEIEKLIFGHFMCRIDKNIYPGVSK